MIKNPTLQTARLFAALAHVIDTALATGVHGITTSPATKLPSAAEKQLFSVVCPAMAEQATAWEMQFVCCSQTVQEHTTTVEYHIRYQWYHKKVNTFS